MRRQHLQGEDFYKYPSARFRSRSQLLVQWIRVSSFQITVWAAGLRFQLSDSRIAHRLPDWDR